jgi:hypothetical protein
VKKKEDNLFYADSALIADLSRAIEDLVLRRKQPGEGLMIEARQLAREWKVKDRSLFDGTEHNKILLLAAVVVGLVDALKRKVQELAEQKRAAATPNELEKLNRESRDADDVAALLVWARAHPKPKRERKPTKDDKPPKEDKRSKWDRSFYNSIEYQFGGGLVADLRKSPALRGLSDAVLQRLGATCLDKIFVGGDVNMRTLEDLFFRIDRKRLGKLLRPRVKKIRHRTNLRQKHRYGWGDVIQIMSGLLKKRPREKRKMLTEKPPKKRGKSKPGPAQQIWLDDRALRERVLNGIEARSNSFPVREDIKSEFLKVVHNHLQRIGKR